MKRALSLFVCVLAFAPRAHAQDDLLRTVDDLIATNRCPTALTLLEHAQGSPAELAGRRGLCEAALGQPTATAHIVEALRSPEDPWVSANRERLLAALAPAAQSSPPPAQEPTPAPAATLPDAPVTHISTGATQIDPAYLERFAQSVPEDVPLRRSASTVRGDRTFVRALVSAGSVISVLPSLGDSPYAERHVGGTVGQTSIDLRGAPYSDWGEGELRPSLRLDVGAEIEHLVSAHVSLVGAFELGVGRHGMRETYVHTTTYLTTNDTDRSDGQIEWGTAFGMRTTLGLRFSLRHRLVLGAGARVGFVRIHAHADLLDSGGDFGFDSDDDSRPAGTPEGTFNRWAGGATVEGVFDVGASIGAHRRGVILLRIGVGQPRVTPQLVVAIPLFGGGQ